MKQAILVWSFRQNIILGSFLQKSSFSTHGGAAVLDIQSSKRAKKNRDCFVSSIGVEKNES